MSTLRSYSKLFLEYVLYLLFKLPFVPILSTYFLKHAMNQSITVRHNNYRFSLATPNYLCHFRASTFSSKEPETLAWIDSFHEDSVFWDIGANIGLYSLYAARHKNCRVIAFEPSFFNLEILVRNINLNNLSPLISVVP